MADSTEADKVYVLLTDRYRISRNVRAEWFLQNLNKTVQIQPRKSLEEYDKEIDIISYIPVENTRSVDVQSDSGLVFISTNTKFTFFSRKYCFVYILDMSTSAANVDIQHSDVLSDELYSSLSKCLENLVKPFYVPGSVFLYQPEIFVTILVYNPFYSNDFNNVIVHGFKLCLENVESLLSTTKDKIQFYINLLHENVKNYSHQSEEENFVLKKTIIPADISLVNMIRFGLLSLNLLPENSQQGIVILTDGNISFPDANALEAALGQLRLSMISCSFVQIGSPAHPDCSLGYVPYTEFLQFISTATFGAYLVISPDLIYNFPPNKFNIFHQAFLVYNFHSGFSSFSNYRRKDDSQNIWTIDNAYFYPQLDNLENDEMRDQQVLRKKLSENKANAALGQILSYRLREGFTIKKVNFRPSESSIDLLLVLPWRHHVNIEYHITAFYPTDLNSLSDEEDQSLTCYEIFVESNYSFLHDITCKKEFKSPYRATTVRQFKAALKNFTDSDQLGIHFHNFAKNEVYRSIPESVKNGVPLFYLMPNCNTPVVTFTNEMHIAKFSQYWKPICMLDINMCQKSSLHSHQINILLKHDMPLPEFLYQPNSSGRHDNIQCNQAMSVLNVMLKEWSSFVLLENHSYIKLIDDANILSCSFYLIRIISQPPCIVLHLAFIGGTSGSLRNQIVNELTLKLKQCKLPQRNLSSSLMQKNPMSADSNVELNHSAELNHKSGDMVLLEQELQIECVKEENEEEKRGETYEKRPPPNSPISCFILLNRPIERMLIRYEKVPKDFNTCYKYEEDWKSNGNTLASLNMFRTLTRYLYHKRFIWGTHCFPTTSLSISSVSKILSVLTMKRIQEGFSLAYNEGGIVNLVMELSMRDETGCESPCLVQYIIFPSNVILRNRDSFLDDLEDDSMSEASTQLLVTECWVEPQNGRVATVAGQSSDHFLQDLDYKHISMSFFPSDFELINSLLTYEYLLTQSINKSHGLDSNNTTLSRDTSRTATSFKEEESDLNEISNSRINFIPYGFNLLTILDKSQQALIKFSMLNQTFELSVDHDLDDSHEEQQMEDGVLLNHGWNNLINTMLYSEFLLKLNSMHDMELVLDQEQSILLIKQANERLATSRLANGAEANDLFVNVDSLGANDAILFRCFGKKISNGCVMLTIVPATYRVLRKLSFIGEKDRLNRKLASDLRCEDDSRYGALVLPIFVHKLTFQSLSSQLLNSDETVDHLYSNWDLMFDYSVSRNKFYFDRLVSTGDNFTFSDEVAIEHFCKTIETLYWNSFTDAIYKSLRIGLPVDERDIRLVLEKISSKMIFSIDITEYILYTCRHMRPLVCAYFDCYPNNTIFDMINYIKNASSESHSKELKTLRLDRSEQEPNCRASCDTLKDNFESLIFAHYSAIPDVPDSYFYDYENIQTKQFTFGLIDIKTKKEHLVRFYNQIENNPILLEFFYKTTKPLYKVLDGVEESFTINDVLESIEDGSSSSNSSPDSENFILSLLLTKPFFISFSYTLTLKSSTQIVKASTIPACVLDLLVDANQDINLENFRVQLNVEVITQNLEYTAIASHKKKSSEYNNRDSEEIYKKILGSTLEHYQAYKYYEFFRRIEWTVMDEVVSISHNLFKICTRTLRSVVEHIQHTGKSHTCFVESFELKFIFPSTSPNCLTNGLEDFRKLLKRLNYSSFALVELDGFFYVKQRKQNYSYYFEPSQSSNSIHFAEEFSEELVEDSESKIGECIVEESDKLPFPNFWIIVSFDENENKNSIVNIYFHSRPNFYLFGMEIFNQIRKSIETLCKKINQRFLLERMNQTKMCDELLISKEDQDPFNRNLRNTLNATPLSHTFLEANNNTTMEFDFEYEEPMPKLIRSGFSFGFFKCDIVWEKHFSVHPRLLLSPTKEGYVAIKSVLASLAVQNRNNLYVYQEKSGAVFYMRIYEMDCSRHTYTDTINRLELSCKVMFKESVDKKDAFYHSIVLATSKELFFGKHNNFLDSSLLIDNTSFREVDLDECASLNESDNESINSLNVSRVYNQCILMNVHGISEPGYEIKHDLAVVLQKRLDEMVLDNLVLTVARNPHSKLTHEDVCFIQSCPPNCEDFYFVINENYFPYLQNIKVYIKQNLLNHHMSNPKYFESQEEFHFRLFKNEQFECVEDDDVFIYYCVEESGRNSKGVAAVILSMVDKEGSQGAESMFVISHSDMSDFVSGNFEYITSCYSHEKENSNVKFYIHFQIWYRGKIDINYVHQILIDTIRNSLWDFNLEFKIFKLCMLEECKNNLNSISEPSTPKKTSEKRERRTGLSIITGFKPSLNQIEDKLYSLKQMRKMSDKSLPMPTDDVTNDNYFNFNSFNNLDLNVENVCQLEHLPFDFQEVKNKELLNLSHFLNVIIKPWLDFGKENRVTSLTKFQMPVIYKNSIPTIIKEFTTFINSYNADMNLHLLKSYASHFFDFDLNSDSVDDNHSLMILLRHENLWNCKELHDSDTSFAANFLRLKNENNKLHFAPSFQTNKSTHDSTLNLNTSKEAANEFEQVKCIAPRQKFLLLYIEDRYLTLYLYNWSQTLSNNISTWFFNLVVWNNARSILMQSLILQRAGIFHNLPFKRYTLEDIIALSSIKSSTVKEKPITCSSIFHNAELLLKYTNHMQALQQNVNKEKEKEQISNTEFMFETKNYDFVFSGLGDTSCKNLFEAFNGKFNSSQINYIKDMKELSKVWQMQGTKPPHGTVDKMIRHVKLYGRLSHYCLTPFLFSHKWRYIISVIRDHTLPQVSNRLRHMSGGHVLKSGSDHEFMINKRSRRKSGPPNMLEHSLLQKAGSLDESLDVLSVHPRYIQEYVQYLQSLGFTSIKSQKVSNLRKSVEFDRRGDSRFKQGSAFSRKNGHKNDYEKFYLIKTLAGGFYMFEVGFCEPYVYSYLYAIDSKRFISLSKNDSPNMNMTNFLDELDSIKVRMHLHSFTYDYHLRAIHSYMAGRQLFFQPGYHLISFLDDFLKYYQKAPNYARNHIYSDYIIFESARIAPDQLYSYIINHHKLYGMQVFPMNANKNSEQSLESAKESVLIRLLSHPITFIDENSSEQEDNFDIGMLASYQKCNFIIKPKTLCLKYFVLLTSQRELYPKLFSSTDVRGEFKTVRVLQSYSNGSTFIESSDPITTLLNRSALEETPFLQDNTSVYNGICDEKINYLGYFNPHEMVMLSILYKQVTSIRSQLELMVKVAETDCRRDGLWKGLISTPSSSQSNHLPPLTMDEFNELLDLVKWIRVDEYDPNLAQFYSFHFNWYKQLCQKLEIKFEFSHRKFQKDGTLKLAIFRANCKDCFILFTLKNGTPPYVEIKLVFKSSRETVIDQTFLEKCNPQYHELVEDFVNSCTSHMWSALL